MEYELASEIKKVTDIARASVHSQRETITSGGEAIEVDLGAVKKVLELAETEHEEAKTAWVLAKQERNVAEIRSASNLKKLGDKSSDEEENRIVYM